MLGEKLLGHAQLLPLDAVRVRDDPAADDERELRLAIGLDLATLLGYATRRGWPRTFDYLQLPYTGLPLAERSW